MNVARRTPGWFAGSLRIALAVPLLAAWIAGCSLPNAAPGPAVPFRLILKPFTIDGLPGLHSVAHAVYKGKLVIVSGRTNGMHDFLPQRQAGSIWSFPPAKANDKVYVVDLETRKLDGSALVSEANGLPSRIARQLRATNTQSFTKNGWFYIVGGYGVTEDGKSMRTFDQVLAIDLAALIETVQSRGKLKLDEQFAKQHMRVGDHPALAVTGGGIVQLGDKTLLVFGQMFNGLYTTDGSVAQQEYSQAVRMLKLSLSTETEDGIPGIHVDYLGKCPNPPPEDPQPKPDGPYHRRDFSLVKVLAAGRGYSWFARYGVFGGVFKGGRMEGYVDAVYITPQDNWNCDKDLRDRKLELLAARGRTEPVAQPVRGCDHPGLRRSAERDVHDLLWRDQPILLGREVGQPEARRDGSLQGPAGGRAAVHQLDLDAAGGRGQRRLPSRRRAVPAGRRRALVPRFLGENGQGPLSRDQFMVRDGEGGAGPRGRPRTPRDQIADRDRLHLRRDRVHEAVPGQGYLRVQHGLRGDARSHAGDDPGSQARVPLKIRSRSSDFQLYSHGPSGRGALARIEATFRVHSSYYPNGDSHLAVGGSFRSGRRRLPDHGADRLGVVAPLFRHVTECQLDGLQDIRGFIPSLANHIRYRYLGGLRASSSSLAVPMVIATLLSGTTSVPAAGA